MTEKDEVIFKNENGMSKSIISSVTVEPLVLFYILPSTMNLLITQNLILEETCRVNLGYNQSVCDSILRKNVSGFTKDQELSVQELASDIIFIKTLTNALIPILILMFVGSWTDKKKNRRPCILGPIIGELVSVTCLILNSVFSHQIPALLTALAYSLPTAISGGLPCLFLGVYSYVSTCSSEASLTLRIGGISTIQKIAYIIGLGISGIILNLLGFIGAYTTTFFMMFSSLVYGYYIIKEKGTIVAEVEEELQELKETPKKIIIRDIYIIEHFFHTLKVFFTRRPSNKRMRFIAAVALLMIVNGPFRGEQSIFFFYTKFMFGWNHLHYGYFYGAQFIIEIIGSLLVLTVLIKYFKWKDEALGVLSFTSSIIASITFAIAHNGILFYTGAVLNLFNGTSQIALRSLMSKLVQEHEIGKTNSIFEITESLTHFIFGAVYTLLYRYTVHIFPGTFFLTSAALKFIGMFIFIWLFHQSIKHKKRKEVIILD